ncbi:DUF4262 domain-containing protein [Mycolicibacter kumamotonensis]|uniref:DUF4262 domain-containing protein n=2 Tax=Mycolicibacter kumamotonensis TaxID=354243 RepID=A0A1B8SCB7_9MYCO|nr:DUF4262 domain-containing protein [Mycolicibacter kumamotonensis]OBY30388.1 hypothetical protein ACT18_17745 [Mycolicibacter kumamotonensis]
MCWMCDHPEATVADWLDEIDDTKTRCGWAVQYVEDDRRPYAYTVGLTDYGLPELLVSGVSPRRAARMLSRFAEQFVRRGAPTPGEQLTMLGGSLVEIVEVEQPGVHMYVAAAFYGDRARALQLVWADGRGHWPWVSSFSAGRRAQPVFGVRAA